MIINEYDQLNVIACYNPATAEISLIIESPSNEKCMIETYNIEGKLIESNHLQLAKEQQTIIRNAFNYAKGPYIVKIVGQTESAQVKVVVD